MIRTRIAPSPTGYLHIGTARTALFNYLFARKMGGKFVVRIEDTDRERSRPEFEKDIQEGLAWLGIHWDEGPDVGGEYGPYRQSERTGIYREYLERLEADGKVYRCFCTVEELEKERELQLLAKQPPRYSGTCAHLSADDAARLEREGRSSVIRFRMPLAPIAVTDLIRGPLHFDPVTFDDFVIAKDFDSPLYNFAVVVDDHLMKISHVIRGEEHISNIPKQVALASALGCAIPEFAHAPLILNPDRSKLSKRQNKVSLLEYRDEGYLPQALINFIAFLGWNPGGENELFSLTELEDLFDLSRVHKAGAIFDLQKLDWFNGQYIRSSSLSDLVREATPFLERAGLISRGGEGEFVIPETGERVSVDWLERVVSLEQQRMKKLSDLPESTAYFFKKVLSYSYEILSWKGMSREDVSASLDFSYRVLDALKAEAFAPGELETALKEAISASGQQNGAILWPLRVALTGMKASPSPFEVASVLGKDKTLARITDAKQSL